jgi:transposase InsO family protein
MCQRIEKGRPMAHVAAEMGISRQTASKWWNRYCDVGEAGLVDRRSIPRRTPGRLDQRTERRIIGLRVNRRWGPAMIAGHLHLVASTVWRVLKRFGISRLRDLDPPSGRIIRRYEKTIPGELIHVDVKKFGKIPDGGGWRVHGRGNTGKRQKLGHSYLHSAVDDYTRMAYSEFCDNEQGVTAISFLHRARQWFADRGIVMQTVMTDNGPCYRSRVFGDTLEAVDINHIVIPPFQPQVNGKVERYQRTLATEWAYTHTWQSEQQRRDALAGWLHQYNHHRPHTAIGGPPATRVNNLPDQYN